MNRLPFPLAVPCIFLTNERITRGREESPGRWKGRKKASAVRLLYSAASRAMFAREFKRLCKFCIKMHSIEISDYSARGDARGIARLLAFAPVVCPFTSRFLVCNCIVGRLPSRILQLRCESIIAHCSAN